MRNRQRGMSYLAVLALIAVVGGLIKVLVVVAPPYLDFFYIDKNIKAVFRETSVEKLDIKGIKNSLATRFQVNGIRDKTPDDFEYDKDGDDLIIALDYEVRRPMLLNIDVVMKFKKTYSSADKSE